MSHNLDMLVLWPKPATGFKIPLNVAFVFSSELVGLTLVGKSRNSKGSWSVLKSSSFARYGKKMPAEELIKQHPKSMTYS